jgi:hypothetical protein
MVVEDSTRPLLTSGHCSQVVAKSGLTVLYDFFGNTVKSKNG